ncbi:hypothetical protein [Stetteria hydrogenophila]
MDCEPLTGPRAVLALSYPHASKQGLERLVHELEARGVRRVCFAGRVLLPGGVRVLGKGHSSVVTAVELDGGEVAALKVLRADSRRESLWGECVNLRRASLHGATPRPRACGGDFIVMDLVWGKSLLDLVEEGAVTARHVREALEAAYALDSAGILHKELHRPWRNIYYPQGSRKALIIDLESSTRGCGNLARLAQAVYVRLVGRPTSALIQLLRAYKESCSYRYYVEIVKEVTRSVDALTQGPRR